MKFWLSAILAALLATLLAAILAAMLTTLLAAIFAVLLAAKLAALLTTILAALLAVIFAALLAVILAALLAAILAAPLAVTLAAMLVDLSNMNNSTKQVHFSNQRSRRALSTFLLQKQTGTPNDLPELFHCWPQKVHATAKIMPQSRPQPLSSSAFRIHYLLITLFFDTMYPELLTS